MTFIEERVELARKFAKILVYFNLSLGVILLFTNYGYLSGLATIITNVIWINLLAHNFPFVSITNINILLGFLSTVVSHCIWLYVLLDIETSGFFAYSLYVTLVWSIPLLIISSLFTVDETADRSENTAAVNQPKSIWHGLLEKRIQWIKSKLPRSGDKLD